MVVIDESGSSGEVLTATSSTSLSSEALDVLTEVEGNETVTVDVPGHGSYRVRATERHGTRYLAGLPTDEVDQSVTWLIRWQLLLAVGVTSLTGCLAFVLVRRHLRPLREVAETAHRVAELPLASGAIGVTERVPEHLTDETTEVGQVGGALNSLLSHVESSLDARHRSEQQVRRFVADASHELRTPWPPSRATPSCRAEHPATRPRRPRH
ncbi:HAMP domain-containing protein [Nocardioides alcanivorans]|uniref:HAMP domain-containing protein n=1 Tax=Nocardioides alcanivorans TaxID=2897352 RepID=UPI001F199BB7|nr:HAMP domain-containing protein [Nocardioides alcanivorans]